MQNGSATGVARAKNGFTRHTSPRSLEEITSEWQCKKRDGKLVPFDHHKIQGALLKCFADPNVTDEQVKEIPNVLALELAQSVVNILDQEHNHTPDVEQVQRTVIRQLWAFGLFSAAEHYQNHREAHRKLRELAAITPEFAAAIAEDTKHFPSDLQAYQHYSKFARWNEEKKRRETWTETCFERVIPWFKSLPKVKLSDAEWDMLSKSMFDCDTSPAMRVMQMAGPALERCHVGAYNCAYLPIEDLRSFAELLYVLMGGGGCGFSVEDQYISQLPRIKKQAVPAVKHNYVVPDTTEGWCDALLFGLDRWFAGEDVWFDVTQIRKKGARLKTKGGRASGPEPLLELVAFTRKLVMSRQGKVLSDIDCHDICCMIGKIVQVGGVRRAATISLSDLDSVAMREAKSGTWYVNNRQRTMANNSACYDGRPDIKTFLDEFTALVKSESGERGIMNRKAILKHMPERRSKIFMFGMNPCGEIHLRPGQFCNLSIVIARPWDTEETLIQKVRIATYWGCMQKTATNFRYLREHWKKNCEEEGLLGVDITGHTDCPLLRFGAPGRAELLRKLKKVVDETDIDLSARFGVNPATARTCVKPSGDSAVRFNCASGVSPWFSDYQMRWVREQASGAMAKFLQAEGVPCATAPEDEALMVFGFPRKAPEGVHTRKDLTAVDQLENWLEWKLNWAEHSVACTVYVDDHEWPSVCNWVWEHFDDIAGVSFLPRDNGQYAYCPNEEITKEQYEEAVAKFPTINWAKMGRYETEDETSFGTGAACSSGVCSF